MSEKRLISRLQLDEIIMNATEPDYEVCDADNDWNSLETPSCWVSVDERLPEHAEEYLCSLETEYCKGVYFVRIAGWTGKRFVVSYDCKVIAWQPLPEPYKERNDEA